MDQLFQMRIKDPTLYKEVECYATHHPLADTWLEQLKDKYFCIIFWKIGSGVGLTVMAIK